MNHDVQTIVISGGMADRVADIAQFGETLLEREDGETVDIFRARAREAAEAAGCGHIVLGGLPKMKFEDEQT
jgi:ATP phosphoribosyltransferase